MPTNLHNTKNGRDGRTDTLASSVSASPAQPDLGVVGIHASFEVIMKRLFFWKFNLILWTLFLYSTSLWSAVSYQQVMSLLEGRHWTLHAESFTKLGVGVEEHLMQIANDATLINYYRFRALKVLELYPTEKVATFLEKYLSQQDHPSLLTRSLHSFSHNFSKTQPERVAKLSRKFLQHQDDNLRLSAAQSIQQVNPREFEKFLRTEPKKWVREAARQAPPSQ